MVGPDAYMHARGCGVARIYLHTLRRHGDYHIPLSCERDLALKFKPCAPSTSLPKKFLLIEMARARRSWTSKEDELLRQAVMTGKALH